MDNLPRWLAATVSVGVALLLCGCLSGSDVGKRAGASPVSPGDVRVDLPGAPDVRSSQDAPAEDAGPEPADLPPATDTPSTPDTPAKLDVPPTPDTPPAPDTPSAPDTPPAPDTPTAPDIPPPPVCEGFSGGCDDAEPDYPWWYWNGTRCVEENSCVCGGCPGTFQSLEQCLAACIGEPQCGPYVGALMDCPYQLDLPDGIGCDFATCLDAPCGSDADCPKPGFMGAADKCVLGSCAWCWADDQCAAGELCRAGRCVPAPTDCRPAPPCTAERCKLVTPSEHACPVCVCDSLAAIPCTRDLDCNVISSFPYRHCVYGRCAGCRNAGDCQYGDCLPPGICFGMEPHPEALYGTWVIGWGGGMDHFSYFRFEPDGTLRRGAYTPEGSYSDDIPISAMPCLPGVAPPPLPLLGTWEPEETSSGFLVVDLALNISCDEGEGWGARFLVNLSEDGTRATFEDVDSDLSYDAFKVEGEACSEEFGECVLPEISY